MPICPPVLTLPTVAASPPDLSLMDCLFRFCSLKSYIPSCHKNAVSTLIIWMMKLIYTRLRKLSEERCTGRQKRGEPGRPGRLHVEMKWTLSMSAHWERVLQLCLRIPFLSRRRTGNEEIQKYSSHPSIWWIPPISELTWGVSLGKVSFGMTELHRDGHQTRVLKKGLSQRSLSFLWIKKIWSSKRLSRPAVWVTSRWLCACGFRFP